MPYTARDYRETPHYFGHTGEAGAALRAIYAPNWTRTPGKRAALARQVRAGVANANAVRAAVRTGRG